MTIRTSTLSNGFQIVTEAIPDYQSASVGVWVKVGARHESANQNGLSHFLEHMVFKGTTKRTALRIADDIESLGGTLNAYTGRERTAFYARMLKDDVPVAIDVIADILRDSLFKDSDIEVERKVILQEISQYEDTPDEIIFDWMQEAAYPNQSMGRPILGTPERVNAFQRKDFQDYVASHYTPDRMVLVAAGGIDHDTIVKQAESLFGDMQPAQATQKVTPPTFTRGQLIRTKDLEQAHYVLALPCSGRTDPDYHTIVALLNILGGGMSSRLFQKAREDLGLCYSIYTSASCQSDSGMFTVYAGTSPHQIRTLSNLVASELIAMKDTLTEKELTSTKTQMISCAIMSQESSSDRCERLASEIIFSGKIQTLEQIVENIKGITLEHAKAVAEKIFHTKDQVMVTYAPEADVPTLDELTEKMVA